MEAPSVLKCQTLPYIVLIVGWKGSDSHWVKGFSTLDAAREAVNEKIAEHEDVMHRILIVKGDIVQMGGGE